MISPYLLVQCVGNRCTHSGRLEWSRRAVPGAPAAEAAVPARAPSRARAPGMHGKCELIARLPRTPANQCCQPGSQLQAG
jgi:hypothetical protein